MNAPKPLRGDDVTLQDSRSYDVERLRKLQMDMALEVKRLCDKHNLRVFLAYGSLLGAVRHKGFIPWDDDIDLWMPRSDYEAFMRLCEKDLAPRWQLQTIETDPALGQLLAKIRARGTRFVHRNSTQVDMDQGIYIDLFPIDNAPDGKVRRRLHAGIHYVLRREMVRRSGYGLSRRGERWAKLIRVPMLLVPTRTVIRLLKRNATRYNAVDTRSMVSLAGAYPYRKEVLCRDWFADRTSLIFEGHDYWAPIAFDSILKQLYGDYMSLPPKSERRSLHDPITVDFGEFDDKSNGCSGTS